MDFFQGSKIMDQIHRVYNHVNFQDGEFLLRVGRFSGKMSITLDNHRSGNEPKSRNLAEGKYPMGWIKCKWIK